MVLEEAIQFLLWCFQVLFFRTSRHLRSWSVEHEGQKHGSLCVWIFKKNKYAGITWKLSSVISVCIRPLCIKNNGDQSLCGEKLWQNENELSDSGADLLNSMQGKTNQMCILVCSHLRMWSLTDQMSATQELMQLENTLMHKVYMFYF